MMTESLIMDEKAHTTISMVAFAPIKHFSALSESERNSRY